MDATPPALVASVPEADAVRVTADRLVLEFSERLDPAGAAPALSLVPAFDAPLDVRVRGRRIEVVFPDSLRPRTTYVVTLGTGLRDEHGVALRRPLTLAFSTGDRLDRGRLDGRVLDPATGRGAAGLAVAAFPVPDTLGLIDSLGVPPGALPDPRTAHPLVYRTESDAEGAFRLDYLRPGPYFVAAFEDRNRNRLVDDGERFAAPAAPVARATEDSTVTPLPDFFVTARDTIPPGLSRVRSRSATRHTLTFDAAIRLRTGRESSWALTDSLDATAAFAVRAVWNTPERPQEVMLLTDSLPARPHRIALANNPAIADSSGNPARVDTYVTPGTESDTAAVRFVGFLPEVAGPDGVGARTPADSVLLLRPDQRPGVRFSQPLDSTALRARVAVVGPEGPLPFDTRTDDGVRYTLRLDAPPRTFRIEVAGADTTYARRVAYPTDDALGAILGQVEAPGDVPVLVWAYPADGEPLITETNAEGRFAFRRLPPGAYRLRLVLDRDRDGAWDGGRLAPYAPPEPIRWLAEPVRVRARWDTEVDAENLRIGESAGRADE